MGHLVADMSNDSITSVLPASESGFDGDYVAYNERPETYIVPVALGIIFLIGVVGNGCLIWIFCSQASVRSSIPNTFIFNLALGDLLVLFCSVPFTSTIYTLESWPYGELVCKASECAKDTSVGVSVFTLTALSLDRYKAIVHPVQSYTSGPRSKRSVIASLGLIWILSLILALPAAFNSHLKVLVVPADNSTHTAGGEKNISVCYPFPDDFGPYYPKVVVMVRFLIHYCLPLLTISTFYAIMARHLLQSTQSLPGQAMVTSGAQQIGSNNQEDSTMIESAQPPSQSRSRRKVAKMVLSFVVLFAICFLPFHVFFLWFYFDPDSLENYNTCWNALKIVGFCLAYTNSCVNPIALYCVSTSFRAHFNQVLCCCCPSLRRRRDQHSLSNSTNKAGKPGSTSYGHQHKQRLLPINGADTSVNASAPSS